MTAQTIITILYKIAYNYTGQAKKLIRSMKKNVICHAFYFMLFAYLSVTLFLNLSLEI